MTDEERQKLCADLRRTSLRTRWFVNDHLMKQAAEEIERLSKQNGDLKLQLKMAQDANRALARTGDWVVRYD